MLNTIREHKLLLLIPLTLSLYYLTFHNTSIFWYMYTFTLLVLITAGILFGSINEEMKTWKSVLFGLVAGIILYLIIYMGYLALMMSPLNIQASLERFDRTLAPFSIWHYLLLMFIIVPGEEVYWRGYLQQQLKSYVKPATAIIISALLFGLALGIGGFWPGSLAGIAVALFLGFLYEWKKSMPLLIVAHLTMVILLFILIPFPMY